MDHIQFANLHFSKENFKRHFML